MSGRVATTEMALFHAATVALFALIVSTMLPGLPGQADAEPVSPEPCEVTRNESTVSIICPNTAVSFDTGDGAPGAAGRNGKQCSFEQPINDDSILFWCDGPSDGERYEVTFYAASH